MRLWYLPLWRVLGRLGVSSVVGVLLLGRGSVVGCLVVVTCLVTSGVVLDGLLLPLRVRAPNVWSGGWI